MFWDYIFKWVSGSQRLLHNMFNRKFHCFMTLAETQCPSNSSCTSSQPLSSWATSSLHLVSTGVLAVPDFAVLCALHHIAWHDLLLIAFRSTGCCSTCADKNAKLLMASRAWAWLRANAAPLGVATPVVGVFASYAWNATETHRMARKIRRGYFQPEAPADYDHRFCLFDRYMMEKASMVGLVGLKSTGKSSTLSHFLREKPNPFYLSLTDGNVYDAMYDQMKDSVLCLPSSQTIFGGMLGKTARRSSSKSSSWCGSRQARRRWGWMWCCPPVQWSHQRQTKQWRLRRVCCWERQAQSQFPPQSTSTSSSRMWSGFVLTRGWLRQS